MLTILCASQAIDVTAEIKRKLEKKEKKQKKRESKIKEEEDGANGTAEMKVMSCASRCWSGMLDLRSCHPLGSVSVYGVP